MSTVPRLPAASHQRTSPDGSFPMYSDEEMASPPMCGHGILKILRKSPIRQPVAPTVDPVGDSSNESKSCLTPSKKLSLFRTTRYEEIEEYNMRSPDTQSSSSSEKSNKAETTPLFQSSKDTATVPTYIVQFDPKELQEVMGEQKKDPRTLNRAKQRSIGQGHGFRPSPWSTSLPVVTEENSIDSDDLRDTEVRAKSKTVSSYHDSSRSPEDPTSQNALVNLPLQEKNDMLVGMRNLVLKQQMKLAELSDQNLKYRREIRSYQHTLLAMKEEQMTQQDQIGTLTIEKETFEAEAIWLRKKMKALQAPHSAPESLIHGDSLTTQFQRLMVVHPEQDQLEDDKEIEFQEFKKTLLSDKIILDGLMGKAVEFSSALDRTGQARDEVTSSRAYDSRRTPVFKKRESTQSHGSYSTSSETRSSSEGSNGSNEEVALFKSRLDSIQQKRIHRRQGRHKSTSRNTVRFDNGL
jgi:hypothetical protein